MLVLFISWLKISITENKSREMPLCDKYIDTKSNIHFSSSSLSYRWFLKAAHFQKKINDVFNIFEEVFFESVLNHILWCLLNSSGESSPWSCSLVLIPTTYNTWQVMGTTGLSYWKSIEGNLSTGQEGQPPHIFSKDKTAGQLSDGDNIHKQLPTVLCHSLLYIDLSALLLCSLYNSPAMILVKADCPRVT